MNEQIKKLSNQAYDELVKETGNIVVVDEDFQQRFAQLIVKKCMTVAKYHTPDIEECEYTWLIHDKIAKHFGVEE